MPKEINFLRDRQRIFSKRQKQDRQLMRISIGAMMVILVVAMIILGVQLFLNNRINNLQDLETNIKADILNREEVEQLFVVNVHKLKALVGINNKRRNKQEAIEYFSDVFGEGVLVKQIEYSGGDNLLTFRLQSDDVFILEDVLEKLKSDEIKEKFVSTKSSNLSRDETGKYEISVAVVLKTLES